MTDQETRQLSPVSTNEESPALPCDMNYCIMSLIVEQICEKIVQFGLKVPNYAKMLIMANITKNNVFMKETDTHVLI